MACEYAWANSRRLQAALAQAGIEYRHHRELAPTTELRQLQYAEDARRGIGKRDRTRLAPAYAERYTREILNRADLAALVADMERGGLAALFCVERDPEACHRSLIAGTACGSSTCGPDRRARQEAAGRRRSLSGTVTPANRLIPGVRGAGDPSSGANPPRWRRRLLQRQPVS